MLLTSGGRFGGYGAALRRQEILNLKDASTSSPILVQSPPLYSAHWATLMGCAVSARRQDGAQGCC
jgi:hypothetical protein